jgi:hypothetical protein
MILKSVHDTISDPPPTAGPLMTHTETALQPLILFRASLIKSHISLPFSGVLIKPLANFKSNPEQKVLLVVLIVLVLLY